MIPEEWCSDKDADENDVDLANVCESLNHVDQKHNKLTVKERTKVWKIFQSPTEVIEEHGLGVS